MSSKHGTNMRMVLAAQLMAGACVAAALGLGGCDSATAEANKKAQQKADEAARLVASAGDVRPTEKFASDLIGKTREEQDKIGAQASAAIKADSQNAKGAWKVYLEERTVAEDLKLGMAELDKAVKTPEFNDVALKSALQSQAGAIASQQAAVKTQEAEGKLTTLLEKALDIQNTADYVIGLGEEAKVQDKLATLSAAANPAKSNVTEAKAAVATAQQAVTDLEKKIADKKARAATVYADADAAIAAADQIKGAAAIEPARKAVEARKEADNLTAEVLNLQPQLSKAKMDLAVAQIHQTEAEAVEVATSSATESGTAAAGRATANAAALRKEAKGLLEQTLNPQYADFKKLADDLDKDVELAAGFGTAADKAYANSVTQLGTYRSSLAKHNEEPNMAVLLKIVKSPEAGQVLQLGQAAAKEETGRAYLLACLAERYRETTSAAMGKAQLAAGLTPEAPTTAPATGGAKAKAITAFAEANAMLDKIINSAPDSEKTDVAEFDSAGNPILDSSGRPKKVSYVTGPTIRWLGLTLRAVAWHGTYIVSGADADLKQSRDAATAARDLNPFLSLEGIGNAAGAPASAP